MISLGKSVKKIVDKLKKMEESSAGVKIKVITKTLDVKKGMNSLGSIGIDVDKVVSISGAVQYTNLALPLSYPMLNYVSGEYINWGLAALVRSGNLELISGAEWNNCKVKVVISYMDGKTL